MNGIELELCVENEENDTTDDMCGTSSPRLVESKRAVPYARTDCYSKRFYVITSVVVVIVFLVDDRVRM